MDSIAQLLADQSGVISRRQLESAGYAPHDIGRLRRRRDLAPIHPGVYLSHTGPPSWIERAWAALLVVSSDPELGDVALAHWSALRIAEGPGRRDSPDQPIHIMVPASRRSRPGAGIVVHRSGHFRERIHPARWPPRIRYEEAVLDVAVDLDDFDALEVLSRAVGGRYSTASRLIAASAGRARVHRRSWLQGVLTDIDQGTHSVLEHGFINRVVRAHGLPVPNQQLREETAIGVVYRDAVFAEVAVELDGRLHHSDMRDRSADLDRDLQAAVQGLRTIRLGWGQVHGRPCRTAVALARVMKVPTVRPCGPECRAHSLWNP